MLQNKYLHIALWPLRPARDTPVSSLRKEQSNCVACPISCSYCVTPGKSKYYFSKESHGSRS